MSSRKCLKEWRTYLKVVSYKATAVLHNINQPSISRISRIFATRSVFPSFGYSVWQDMVKGKLIMLGDWQNARHVGMWEQGIKFLMSLIVRIFLEVSLLRNQILNFLKANKCRWSGRFTGRSKVEKIPGKWWLRQLSSHSFSTWFHNL